jgi:3',5'-nucleoside bisphosphate phosphatase
VRADLHSHSSASDGTRPPADVIRRAAAACLDAIALTDHDTVEGIAEAAGALPPGLALIPGMELSCRRDGHSVHMLAYLFDPAHPGLAGQCELIRNSRVDRAKAMVTRLNELGVPVSWDQVTAIAGGGVIGRPHIARAMVLAGAIESADQAFSSAWIGPAGRAHVRRYALDPVEAIALVHAAGGVIVLAHPFAVTRALSVPEDLIGELAEAGLDGLEVAHPDHDRASRDRLAAVARELNLAVTGGSDDHGEFTADRIGTEWTCHADLDRLLGPATGLPVITR